MSATPPQRHKQSRASANRGLPRSRQTELAKLLADPAARPARLPATAKVELATLVKRAPAGDEWLHEIKFDGYRMMCRLDRGKVQFLSRNGKDWTALFPELAAASAKLPMETALLDGEVAAVDAAGITSFQRLQQAFQGGSTRRLVYYAFDVLHVAGRNVTHLPLERRKEIVQCVLAGSRQRTLRVSEHLRGTGPEVFAQACRLGLEGIVSKRRGSPYRPGRGLDWLKVKCSHREEFVIGGYSQPGGSREHFGAILVGYYDERKRLIYAGRVGTGFDRQTLADLARRFARLERPRSPFANLAGSSGAARGVVWLAPRLVAEVEFSNWTDDRLLRHPAFQGLREDKRAGEFVREVPAP